MFNYFQILLVLGAALRPGAEPRRLDGDEVTEAPDVAQTEAPDVAQTEAPDVAQTEAPDDVSIVFVPMSDEGTVLRRYDFVRFGHCSNDWLKEKTWSGGWSLTECEEACDNYEGCKWIAHLGGLDPDFGEGEGRCSLYGGDDCVDNGAAKDFAVYRKPGVAPGGVPFDGSADDWFTEVKDWFTNLDTLYFVIICVSVTLVHVGLCVALICTCKARRNRGIQHFDASVAALAVNSKSGEKGIVV